VIIGSLFAGIGGFDLAARWIGWQTKWYSEIDEYAIRVMERWFPEAYNVGDITTWEPISDANSKRCNGLWRDGRKSPEERQTSRIAPLGTVGISTGEPVANTPNRRLQGTRNGCSQKTVRNGRGYSIGDNDKVDVICGGFPCQPVSLAGKRMAQDDPRWLWPHFARTIRILQPRYVVVENVPGLLSRGMGDVLGDLSTIGYDAEWQTIPAAAVGAPHRRDRIWIVAYAPSNIRGTSRDDRSVAFNGGGADVANATSIHVQGHNNGPEQVEPWRSGWWDVEPNVGRVADGVPSRVDRLKCLGNAIVPQIAYWIFQQIEKREAGL